MGVPSQEKRENIKFHCKMVENRKFCRALAQFRGKTSCIS